jgi:hypothetical protein
MQVAMICASAPALKGFLSGRLGDTKSKYGTGELSNGTEFDDLSKKNVATKVFAKR